METEPIALPVDYAVERFDISVVGEFSGPREVQMDPIQIGPLVEQWFGKFRPAENA